MTDVSARNAWRAARRAQADAKALDEILAIIEPDYPLQGTKTSQFQQVGNAIPPPMAEAILKAVTS